MASQTIALLIEGSATVRGGLEPLVSVGVVPSICESEPFNALLKEPQSYLLRYTPTHKCYTLIDRAVRPYGTTRKGVLSISIAISSGHQLANRQSPLTLLQEVYHTFVAINMWAAPTGEHIFNEGEYSRDIFVSLMGKYRLEDAKDEYIPMSPNGKKAVIGLDDDTKLAELMRDTQYPELSTVSQLEIGRECASTITITIPRSKKKTTRNVTPPPSGASQTGSTQGTKDKKTHIVEPKDTVKGEAKSEEKAEPKENAKAAPKTKPTGEPNRKLLTLTFITQSTLKSQYLYEVTMTDVAGSKLGTFNISLSRQVGTPYYIGVLKLNPDQVTGGMAVAVIKQEVLGTAKQTAFFMGNAATVNLDSVYEEPSPGKGKDKVDNPKKHKKLKRFGLLLLALFLGLVCLGYFLDGNNKPAQDSEEGGLERDWEEMYTDSIQVEDSEQEMYRAQIIEWVNTCSFDNFTSSFLSEARACGAITMEEQNAIGNLSWNPDRGVPQQRKLVEEILHNRYFSSISEIVEFSESLDEVLGSEDGDDPELIAADSIASQN